MKNCYTLTLFLFLTISLIFNLQAQDKKALDDKVLPDSVLVQQCIQNLFDGMRAADSVQVRACFRDDVRMASSFTTRTGKAILDFGSLPDFLEAVVEPRDIVWDERIDEIYIRIDDNMAQVWTEYEFFLGERFSHCGVNAFQLIKQEGIWKIFNLTDTRRREGCRSD